MLEKFYKGNQNFKKDLEKAIKKGDTELAERIVHTLKGVSGNLGMNELHKLTKELERFIKENIDKVDAGYIDKVNTKLQLLLENINQSFKTSGTQEEMKEVTIEAIRNKLETLKEKLEDYDSDAGEIINEIGSIKGFENESKELYEAIKNYEFEKALLLLKKING